MITGFDLRAPCLLGRSGDLPLEPHLQPRVGFSICYEMGVYFHSSACGYPVFSAHHICVLIIAVENQLAVNVEIYS
jgi:hypothetical protein